MTASLLIDSSVEKLPDEVARLLDPSEPPPPEHVLVPHGLGWIFPSAVLAAVALLCGLVFASGAVRDEATVLRGIYGVLAAVCLVAGFRPARRSLLALRARASLAAGRWRRGLHLLPDALLLWDGRVATLVPRAAVVRVHFVARSEGSPYRTVLEVRREDEEDATVELAPIPPPDLGEEGADGALFAALSAWRENGRFEPSPPAPPSGLVRSWVRNIVLGHLVLLGVGALGLVVLTPMTQILGRTAGALLGLLLGVPIFLGFPAILERLVGRRLTRETESGRPLGWGYLFLLGLAALFVIVVGTEAAGTLWWQLRATERGPATLAEMESSAGVPVFYRWPQGLRPVDGPVGYHVNRLFLGDASWVQSSYYVAPLADGSGPASGCVWYGLRTSEGARSSASVRRLLGDPSPWLVEAAGLETSAYQAAVADTLRDHDRAEPSCRQPVVLEGSVSRRAAIRASTGRLGQLQGLAHGLPLLVLLAWAAWRYDRQVGGWAILP